MDANPDRMDLRDRPFMPRRLSLPREFSEQAFISKLFPKYSEHLILDQKKDGSCVQGALDNRP